MPVAEAKKTINMMKCPICKRHTVSVKSITETQDPADAALWYECNCGVVFQENQPKREIKDWEYLDKHFNLKEFNEILTHTARTYATVIEEATYGRKMLDVGYCFPQTMNFMKERGWITFGIENNKDAEKSDRMFKADFEKWEYDKQKFDLIWMSHVLEGFKDPVKALKKANELLQDNGVIFIATPDVDFIKAISPMDFQHWKKGQNYIMWNERSLEKTLNECGFNVIVKKRNFYNRYGYYHDLHIVAQKTYY